jgi:hypothetical protein
MSTNSELHCSICKKSFATGSMVLRCTVSTCNSGKIKLVFCSAACWDAHLPTARHRSAGYVEERFKPGMR